MGARGATVNMIGKRRRPLGIFAMTAPLKTVESTSSCAGLMHDLGVRARHAARVLALAPTRAKDTALAAMADECRARKSDILAANAQHLAEARASGAGT